MEISPATVRDTRFDKVKRGYDAAQVDAFVAELADALEKAQNETTAMEARARAAVARLQELSQGGAAGSDAAAAASAPSREITTDESETISRTLLLAQRTADATLAEARSEADRVLAAARDEAAANLDSAREQSATMIEEAKAEARRSGESERVQAESEVQSLLARRDFLESDVDHLEQFLVAQRERIAEAAAALTDIVDRVPGGLAEMRKPLLSAADTAVTGEHDGDEAEADPDAMGAGDEGPDTTPSEGRAAALGDLRAVPDPGDLEDDSGAEDPERPFPPDPGDLQSTQQLPLTDR